MNTRSKLSIYRRFKKGEGIFRIACFVANGKSRKRPVLCSDVEQAIRDVMNAKKGTK